MIPDYQTLMRPVLETTKDGEIHTRDIILRLAEKYKLTDEELNELLPSGKQTRFSNRVGWARAYLKQAMLVKATRRGYIEITERGKEVLNDSQAEINARYLRQFEEFESFRARTKSDDDTEEQDTSFDESITPDETLRKTYTKLNNTLAAELLEQVRNASPAFFERMLVELLVAMGYGGSNENAGRALGQAGDDGVDGVIDQDPLGVDQIYIQAKRYAESNKVSPDAIRDFCGALSLKKAHKGIFFTTSDFTSSATETAKGFDKRILLINGTRLSKLMIEYNIGCRDEDVIHIKRLDEDFFESEG